MLDKGQTAPDFSLPDGAPAATLHALAARSGRAVVYFYPADSTPACTAEACMFRDVGKELENEFPEGAPIVGVSPQGEKSHQKFAARNNLSFTLVSDPKKSIIKSYGCAGPLGLMVRRVSFVLDAEARVIERVVADFRIGKHRQAAEALRRS